MHGAWGERRYSSCSFLTSSLEGGVWSASRPGRASPRWKDLANMSRLYLFVYYGFFPFFRSRMPKYYSNIKHHLDCRQEINVRFKVSTAVMLLITSFWVKAPCIVVGRSRRFGGVCRLHLQGWSDEPGPGPMGPEKSYLSVCLSVLPSPPLTPISVLHIGPAECLTPPGWPLCHPTYMVPLSPR
jgi:hypothetical protein